VKLPHFRDPVRLLSSLLRLVAPALDDGQPRILRKLRICGRPSTKIESGAAGGLDPLHIAAVSAQTDAAPLPVCIVADHSVSHILAAHKKFSFKF
jgi:hypothetical protein